MNQHPFPATNVQCIPLLAFKEVTATEQERAKQRAFMETEKGRKRKKISYGEKWHQINIKKPQKEIRTTEHALKAKGRSGRMADSELW